MHGQAILNDSAAELQKAEQYSKKENFYFSNVTKDLKLRPLLHREGLLCFVCVNRNAQALGLRTT